MSPNSHPDPGPTTPSAWPGKQVSLHDAGVPGSVGGLVGPAGIEIAAELGRGAQAVVYRARRQGRDYALKLLQVSGPVGLDTGADLRREAAWLTRVAHPGLARVHDVGLMEGQPYLVTDLVEGQTLAALVARGPLPEVVAAQVGIDVAGALAAAHRFGLVHRDVKPHNIIVQPGGRVKIIDFGLAAQVNAVSETAAGTFAYVAPEQTGMLNRLVDGRSDLYALGVVLYQCIAGELPFVASDAGELLRMHAVAAAPDPRTVRPEVSAGFAAVIGKLLAKDPDDRYQSGAGLIADLERVRESRGGSAFPVGERDAPARLAEGELLGREAELAELTDRWRSARAGAGAVCLIRGGAGIGKTRLADELGRCAAADGAPVLRGACRGDDGTPLAPLRQAVDQYLRELDRLAEPARSSGIDRVLRAARPSAALLAPLSPALATMIGDVPAGPEDRPEQFAGGVAGFLADLAKESGGLVLHLDEVGWLDTGTRRVLARLADELASTPLLVVATTRDDPGHREAVTAFEQDLDEAITCRMSLSALDDAALGRLVATQLAGAAVPSELTAQIIARSGGNPFVAVEYLRAIVEAGLIRASWGVWYFDQAAFDVLDLPDDALDLVTRRLDGIDQATRAVLMAAAAVGAHFDPVHLAAVCEMDDRSVFAAVDVAVRHRLIGPYPNNQQTFVHDRIRQALLAEVDPARRRALHQRIAEVLDAAGLTHPDGVYAVATQYRLGETTRDPAAVVRTCHAAGALALNQHAPHQALEFLTAAALVAEAGGLTLSPGFASTLGRAYVDLGRTVEAREWLERALVAEPDPIQRAALYGLLADVHLTGWDFTELTATIRRGLADLGRPLPTNPLVLLGSSLGRFGAALVVSGLGIGFGTATGAQRERYRLEAMLLERLARGLVTLRRPLLQLCLILRQVYPVNRLGPSYEYIYAHTYLGYLSHMLRMRRRAERKYESLRQIASGLGDMRYLVIAQWSPILLDIATDRPSRSAMEKLRRLVNEAGRWFEMDAYLTAVFGVCWYLNSRGHAADSLAWLTRVVRRTPTDDTRGPELRNPAALAGVFSSAMLGRDAEAREQLRTTRAWLDVRREDWQQWAQYVEGALATAVELDELGEPFEEAVADLRRMGLTPWRCWPAAHIIWIFLAYGRLEQCRTATAAEFPARLAAARRAVRATRRLARIPFHAAHCMILRAGYRHLAGDSAGALRLLRRAEAGSHGLDSPIVNYEIARLRARALTALGHAADAHQYATTALAIATAHHWPHRINWIRAEFDVGEVSLRSYRDSGNRGRSDAAVVREQHRRRLDALQQVSLTAASVLDPQRLARVALDETIRIFGAERAFLFLIDEDTRRLLPNLGRDNTGQDLTELTGYSTTFVERVRDGADALVLTADSDGRSVASHSARVHGLRSVMVAPLRLKDRLLGVVYLDSRVAKGIFTTGDVDMLVAITNHVAVSLETARAAQLEVAVHTARRQRDLAETLRFAGTEISSTLDPDEVLHRMLTVVAHALHADSGCLLRTSYSDWSGATLTVAAVAGHSPTAALGKQVDPATDPALTHLTITGNPVRGTAAAGHLAPLPEFLPNAGSWIVLPVATPDTTVGILIITATRPDAYTDTDTDIVVALTNQAMVAYDKAVLFDQVRQLAILDPLTGVANRRRVLEAAEQRFADAAPADGDLSVIMIDIDHFKTINDTHGHQAGDDVIKEVAHRLRTVLRPDDLLGRYGGEEFLVTVIADRAGTHQLAERLRATVAGTPIPTLVGPLAVTTSVGIGHIRTDDASLATVVGRADQALYAAKEQGRNRVMAI